MAWLYQATTWTSVNKLSLTFYIVAFSRRRIFQEVVTIPLSDISLKITNWRSQVAICKHLTCLLTHWGQDKMDVILHTTLSNAFSSMKIFEFGLKCHWRLFLSDYNSALVQVMAWRCPCDKALSEPMLVCLLMHLCITRPHWVKEFCIDIVVKHWQILPIGLQFSVHLNLILWCGIRPHDYRGILSRSH